MVKKTSLIPIIILIFSVSLCVVACKGSETQNSAGESATEAETETEEVIDRRPPAISGVVDMNVYAGDIVHYKLGVEVTDDLDPNPKLTIDNSAVDITTPGIYPVTYCATDSAGNSKSITVTLEVLEDNQVTDEQVDEICAEICDAIIPEDASDSEKIHAVYDFIYDIGYTPIKYASIPNYKTNAYYYYVTRRGNCNCSCGLAKALLDYLGYDNFFVSNLDGNQKTHYWNFVTVDGENWYHFDATKNYQPDTYYQVCMLTDEQLDSICEQYPDTASWYARTEDTCPATSEIPFE